MADRYWVGGTANWDATVGTKWATTSGGAGGSAVPTIADDVFFDAASGAVTITLITANATCRSLNCTGFTGTFTHSAGILLTLGDATAGAGNIALKFVAGMTYTALGSNNSFITFASTNATQQTVDFAGKTISVPTFNGAAGSWILSSALTSTSTLTLTAGTLNTNSQTISCSIFTNSGSTTRTLTLGSSAISCSASTNAFVTRFTNLTMTANTAVVTCSGNTANAGTSTTGGNMNGTSLVFTGTNPRVDSATGTTTWANITHTGTAVKSCTLGIANTGSLVITGAFTVNGNSAINRVLVFSSTLGTAMSISAGSVSTSNTDWRDITGTGVASWNLSAITGLSGDCGGNTGITFTTPTTQTATGTASFTWSTHGWTTRVPLPQDTALISNAFVAGRTVTIDMPRVGGIDFSASTGNVIPSFSVNPATEVYGDCKFRAGMGAFSAYDINFIGPSTQQLTMGGNAFPGLAGIFASRSKLELQDNLISPNYNFTTANSGYVDTQGFNVSSRSFTIGNSSNVNVFGTSTITFTTNLTLVAARVSAASATIIVGTASTGSRTVALGAASIGTLTYTVANSPGPILVTGGGTIGTLNLNAGKTFQQTNGTTLNIGTTINATGVPVTGLNLPGLTGNYASVPNSVPLQITGSIDLRAKVTLPDWTPASGLFFIAKWTGGAAGSYSFSINPSGYIGMGAYNQAGVQVSANSGAAAGFADGSTNWLRVTWNSSTNQLICYTGSDGISWTQLGSPGSLAGTTSLQVTSQATTFGVLRTDDSFGFAPFTIHRAQIRNNVLDDGTGIVLDANFDTKACGADTFIESSSNAATITLTGVSVQAADGGVRFRSSTPGSAATLSKTSGTIQVTNASLRDSTATGGATFNAIDSHNWLNNTGWNFLSSSNGNFLQMF